MNVTTMVTEAAQELRDFMLEDFEAQEWVGNKALRNHYRLGNILGTPVRLRLDWTFAEEVDWKEVHDLMFDQMCNDIEDLVINGDVNSQDVLYKTMNGSIVRGKDIEAIDFISAAREVIHFKDHTSINIHLLIRVLFEGDKDA